MLQNLVRLTNHSPSWYRFFPNGRKANSASRASAPNAKADKLWERFPVCGNLFWPAESERSADVEVPSEFATETLVDDNDVALVNSL